MPSVKFRYRILTDIHFVRWLINKDKTCFLKLTHIKASSADCKKEHNVIVEEDAQKIIEEKNIKESNLRAAFKGLSIPHEITKVLQDKYDRMILFAIVLATDKPYFTYILTTKDHISKYNGSLHIKNVKSISVKSEEEALKIIDILWQEFCFIRETKR
ncbi:hypothetical protein HYY69_00630 [Candidatus Woesearchaeota archaeon]|nr:hypothetical protein [Candidatus Woesearchaeota archaeon]